MIIDKPKKTSTELRKYRNNMKLEPSELNQLEVFDELVSDSLEHVLKTKLVKRKKRDENKVVVLDEAGQEVWEDHVVTKLSIKKNVDDYNTFRRRKKEYLKGIKK